MQPFDAAVVGAGPAGSLTAYHLAATGLKVLLVDRATFPRDKPCGGGVTTRAARQLPFSIEPVVEDVVSVAEVRRAGGTGFERRAPRAICLMTQRRRLDAFLLERAAQAGAEVRDGVRVEVDDGRLTVDGSHVHARVLVGADGANGIVARRHGLGLGVRNGVALEGNVSYGDVARARYAGRLVLELGAVPGGYGWVFPKGDHVNVGVGGWGAEGPRLRAHLRALCDRHGIRQEAVTQIRGHRLPMRRPEARLAREDILLVGDAAGLVDPVSGDGMYEAFVSARLAAEAIAAGAVERYEPALRARLDPLARAGWGAKVALDRFPRATFTVLRFPLTWKVIEQVMLGDLGHPGAARGLQRRSMQLVEALARRAGDPGRAFASV